MTISPPYDYSDMDGAGLPPNNSPQNVILGGRSVRRDVERIRTYLEGGEGPFSRDEVRRVRFIDGGRAIEVVHAPGVTPRQTERPLWFFGGGRKLEMVFVDARTVPPTRRERITAQALLFAQRCLMTWGTAAPQ